MILTDEEREALGHRIAWRYKKSSDPHHSDTYTFNRATLLRFSEAVEREVLRKLRERPADAWLVRRLDAPLYPIMFMHKPVDALADPERSVQELHIIPEDHE